MPGLAVKINTSLGINAPEVINAFKDAYKIPSLRYHEEELNNSNYVFYCCFPEFLTDRKLMLIDDYIIMYDGDIYNCEELSRKVGRELLSKHHLIYFLFKKYGNNFGLLLNGDFNIVIYNLTSKELLITNDRFARRPFFYHVKNKEIVLASEKKAIVSVVDDTTLDYVGLLQLFSITHNLNGRSFIKDIVQLQPASVICINEYGVKCSTYYQWFFQDSSNIGSRQEKICEIYSALNEAVNKRLAGKKRICLWLSGGMDSRGIACSIDPENRSNVIAVTCGLPGSLEIDIAKKICAILKIRHFAQSINQPALLLAQIGAWRSEFAASACRHPFSAFHKELKQQADYVVSGLPGFDTLNNCLNITSLALSLIPVQFAARLFNKYIYVKTGTLQKLFHKEFLEKRFHFMKEEFISSINRIEAVNNLDRYHVWIIVQRQPQFSHMADLVERDMFEVIAPFTDIWLQRLFTSIPLKERLFGQYSKDLVYKYFPKVRGIEYDRARGYLHDNNTLLRSFYRTVVKHYKKDKGAGVWDITSAIRMDAKIRDVVVSEIKQDEELHDYIFNLNYIKHIFLEHDAGIVDHTLLIDTLLTFVLAYKYLCSGSRKVPETVAEYYSQMEEMYA